MISIYLCYRREDLDRLIPRASRGLSSTVDETTPAIAVTSRGIRNICIFIEFEDINYGKEDLVSCISSFCA